MAVLTQKTCVYDCRLILYQFKFNISLLSRFMKPRMGIIDESLLQRHQFLSHKLPILKENELILWLFWPKTHVFVVVDQDYTIPKSILVVRRFMKPGMAPMVNFPVQPHLILQRQPSFWWEMD